MSKWDDLLHSKFDKAIPDCHPAIKKYYTLCLSEPNFNFTAETNGDFALGMISGYANALIRFCRDLSEAAIGAEFDLIIGKLNEK